LHDFINAVFPILSSRLIQVWNP